MRLSALLLGFLLIGSSPAAAGDVVPELLQRFLAGREMVGAVSFAAGSAELTPYGKTEIDRIVPLLNRVDPQEKIIRIEGFAGRSDSQGQDTMGISMQRARVVEEYIQSYHRIGNNRFLTGFSPSGHMRSTGLSGPGRAEIALYPNPWQGVSTSLE